MQTPIHSFVIGESDVERLADVGIGFTFDGSGVQLEEPAGLEEVVRPTVAEVAQGFIASWARGRDALQRWAQVVLALSAIDLADLEDRKDGEELLNAVWDAADGNPAGLDLAARLAND